MVERHRSPAPAASAAGLSGTRAGTPLAGSGDLLPTAPAISIARPRVDRLLDGAADHRVIVLAAGPGWGKTTAVARWLATTTLPGDLAAGWLTLNPGLDDAASFWDAVLRAFNASGAVSADNALSFLSPRAGVTDDMLRLLHEGLSSIPGRVLLVLDDFHVIEDEEVLDAVADLVARHTRVSVMLLSRVQPMLALHRLRLAGELLEISTADLALDRDEIAGVGRSVGLFLSDDEVAAVLERTQGWPAGVRLAALHLSRQGPQRDMASFGGTERSIAEYLLAEVLARNSPEGREFLMRTSLCDPICAELAEAIAPSHQAQALLEGFERHNEFVTALGADRVWFRYHPLLRELLAHNFRRDHPEAHREAHRGAAMWHAQHHEPMDALAHASAAEDWLLFEKLYVTSAGPHLVGAQWAALHRQLVGLPYGDLSTSPEAELCRAGLALREGRPLAIPEHLAEARAQIERSAEPVDPATVALLELLAVAAAWARGDVSAVADACGAVIAAIDAADPFPAKVGYRSIALMNLGQAQFWSGNVAEAQQSFMSMLAMEDVGDTDLALLGVHAQLAFIDVLQVDLAGALGRARRTIDFARARGWSVVMQTRAAHTAMAWVQLLRDDRVGSGAALAAGLAATAGGTTPMGWTDLRIVEAKLAVSLGRPDAAQRAAAGALEMAERWRPPPFAADELTAMQTDVALLTGDGGPAGTWPAPGTRSRTEASSRARLLLADGDVTGARELATQVADDGQGTTIADLVALVDSLLVLALAADAEGRALDASTALQRAIETAEPHQLVRPFLVTGSARTPAQLRRLAAGQTHPAPFLRDVLQRTSTRRAETPEPAPLMEPLTGRELAMLAELPTMKTNAEIAAEYFVSVNTVKAHLKSLYRKLDVASRRAAVQRAQDLHLLP